MASGSHPIQSSSLGVYEASLFILSIIIPGKQMTGNDIDAYLQPLIKELKELCFDGVYTFNYSEKKCLHCERLYGQLVTS